MSTEGGCAIVDLVSRDLSDIKIDFKLSFRGKSLNWIILKEVDASSLGREFEGCDLRESEIIGESVS